jgi:hypothetical protein
MTDYTPAEQAAISFWRTHSLDEIRWEYLHSSDFKANLDSAASKGDASEKFFNQDLGGCSRLSWNDAIGRVLGPGSQVPPFNPFKGVAAKQPPWGKDNIS